MTQEEFDKQFITMKEIAEFLGMTVQAIWYAKDRGQLPGSIQIKYSKALIWKRDDIMPRLETWKNFRADRLQG